MHSMHLFSKLPQFHTIPYLFEISAYHTHTYVYIIRNKTGFLNTISYYLCPVIVVRRALRKGHATPISPCLHSTWHATAKQWKTQPACCKATCPDNSPTKDANRPWRYANTCAAYCRALMCSWPATWPAPTKPLPCCNPSTACPSRPAPCCAKGTGEASRAASSRRRTSTHCQPMWKAKRPCSTAPAVCCATCWHITTA